MHDDLGEISTWLRKEEHNDVQRDHAKETGEKKFSLKFKKDKIGSDNVFCFVKADPKDKTDYLDLMRQVQFITGYHYVLEFSSNQTHPLISP